MRSWWSCPRWSLLRMRSFQCPSAVCESQSWSKSLPHPSLLLSAEDWKRAGEGFSYFFQTSSAGLFHPIKPEPATWSEQSKWRVFSMFLKDDAKPICSSLLPVYCIFSLSVFTFLQLELLCQSRTSNTQRCQIRHHLNRWCKPSVLIFNS